VSSGVGASSLPPQRRPFAAFLFRNPKVGLVGLLSLPVVWLVAAYLVSLFSLLLVSLYQLDVITFQVDESSRSLTNLIDVYTERLYRATTIRTVTVAALVTLASLAIALPMAYYMAKIARPGLRRALVIGILMPLWASYLVKGYAWKAMLDPASGVLEKTIGWSPGFSRGSVVLVLTYLWVPYMILPIYAGLERLPGSLLEASADLGGTGGRTFRSVILPLLVPSIVAGSIFTFSLSLGDYITVGIIGGKTQMIGNVIYRDFGTNNTPLAGAFATVPVLIMIVYLLLAKRTGALENL
jgi:ABC-type spermidine/putrescine transport system permease subunit I